MYKPNLATAWLLAVDPFKLRSITSGDNLSSPNLIILPINCVSIGSLLIGVASTIEDSALNEIPSEKIYYVVVLVSFRKVFH